jgi:hypothetical protein
MNLPKKFKISLSGFKRNSDKYLVFILALSLALRDLRVTPYDDAAITYRYAWNISHWHGWVYNVGDRTNGASSPFYTILLAIGSLFGAPLPGFSEALDAVAYAFVAVLIYLIITQVQILNYKRNLSNYVISLSGVFLFLISEGARSILLSGMESAVCSAIGLFAIWAILNKKYSLAWFLMGLALFSKLDAFALLPTMIFLQVRLHKPSKKETFQYFRNLILIILPWLVFSQVYFGSMLPHSASEKISGSLARSFKLNHLWIVDHLVSDGYLIMLVSVIVLSILFLWQTLEKKTLIIAISILAWPILHGAFFSIVNLGDQYDWYLGVLYAPLIISMAILLKFLYEHSAIYLSAILKMSVVAAICASIIMGHNLKATFNVVLHGHQISSYEGFERTRAQAGYWLGTHTSKSEVIMTCFGWVAWGARQNPFLETCPLSTRKSVGSPNWFVDFSFPGVHVPKTSPIGKIVKVFTSSTGTGGASWIVKLGPSK